MPRPNPTAADRPMSDEFVVLLRVRVQAGFYDRPDVVDAVARSIAARATAPG